MDKQHLKAQTAIEFMILAGFLLFMFIVMLGLIAHQTNSVNKDRQQLIGEDIVTVVQKEFNLAARVSNGYSRDFYLPSFLGSHNYTISIVANEVIVNDGTQDFSRAIPTVKGSIKKGFNHINKTNEQIYIN